MVFKNTSIQLIITSLQSHNAAEKSNTICLKAGKENLLLDLYEGLPLYSKG